MQTLAVCLTTLMIVIALLQLLQGVWMGYSRVLPWCRRTLTAIDCAIARNAHPETLRALRREQIKLGGMLAFMGSGKMLACYGLLCIFMVAAHDFEPTAFIETMIMVTVVVPILLYCISTMFVKAIEAATNSAAIKGLSYKWPRTSSSSVVSLCEAPYEPPRSSLPVTA